MKPRISQVLYVFYLHALFWTTIDGATTRAQFSVGFVPSGQFQTSRIVQGVKHFQSCTYECIQLATIEGFDRNVCRIFYHDPDLSQCYFGSVNTGLGNTGTVIQVLTADKCIKAKMTIYAQFRYLEMLSYFR